MEVANNSDSDKPWELNYRYTGYNNLTKSGYTCKVRIGKYIAMDLMVQIYQVRILDFTILFISSHGMN